MLNPHLYLNTNMFDEDAEKKPTRDGFGTGLVKLGTEDPNVVVLTADLSESTRTDGFEKAFPERFFEMGVAEQNMATVAAGLGVSGKTAFISSYATFSPGRNWEQIRTTIVYNNANVKVAGHHSGVMTGPDGATHQATEDIAITRVWPGMDVIVPCDSIEAEKATIAAGKKYGPVYLRFTRDKTPVMTTDKTPFEIGKARVFWTSEQPEVTILATGYMLYQALLAAKKLDAEGIPVLVINVPSIKPMDTKTIVDAAAQTGAVVTVEDHQTAGGLGGAVAELLAQHRPTPMEFIGLTDTFAESGKPEELLKKYKMDDIAIIEKVKKIIGRK
ncbi:MAG TPA: transketolase C-terminal domain-containing protein [Candidatus Saccharimonadales bacterium]|nr:transketolase C-terminal domain-containing protein [Candidatus Saccharimonadales bacterium]